MSGVSWWCPNCRREHSPIFNGRETAGCIVCGAEMKPELKAAPMKRRVTEGPKKPPKRKP